MLYYEMESQDNQFQVEELEEYDIDYDFDDDFPVDMATN